jgi:hypothetical protein
METRDELLWALGARIAAFMMTQDRVAVLAPEALEQARALMACIPDPTKDREAVQMLADLYRARALLLGDPDGGRDATIARALERLAGAGPGPAHFPAGPPTGLTPAIAGGLLQASYEQAGRLPDLQESIRRLREAAAATASAHPDRASVVSMLGVALRNRFNRTGALADLDESIVLAREAVAATAAGDFNHGGHLSNLGIALRLRSERTRSEQDLDDAVAACREAVAVTPQGHPGYGIFRNSLSAVLGLRYDRFRDVPDILEQVSLLEEAVRREPEESRHRVALLGNLASALVGCYRADIGAVEDGDADIERAEALLHEALVTLPEARVDRASIHYELGVARHARFVRRGRYEDLVAALASVRTAAQSPDAPLRVRLRTAIAWGEFAMDAADYGQAAAGYQTAVEVLSALPPRGLVRGEAADALADFPGVACNAAAAAIAAGDPALAVTLLEQGRGIALSQLLQGRDDLAELREHPDLAMRFTALRNALDGDLDDMAVLADALPRAARTGETAADLRQVLAAEWDQLLAGIRQLPGHAEFLRPPPLRQLLAQAKHGPIAVLNVSKHRCDALLLTPNGLRVAPLPGLSLADAVQQAVGVHSALAQPAWRTRLEPDWPGVREEIISASLAWLWETVTGPVLAALGIEGPPASNREWPRIWWIPTGPLAFLPVHAAGYHRQPGAPTVMDRVVSSYSPTIWALAHARRPPPRDPAPPGTHRFLIASVPEAPGFRPLAQARGEATALARLLPGAHLVDGPDATRSAVLAGIADHPWFHYCGHGEADPVQPSNSRLIVYDHREHPLTVSDIARLNLADADLAYLSACTTALTGFSVSDEALHLAGALQFAGYRHVIGTLWQIADKTALEIAKHVYTELGAPSPIPDRAAIALHAAIRTVRDSAPDQPSRWAAHVHSGA